MALAAYLATVQRLLGTGTAGNLYTTADLTAYINQAREQVAADGQCVRALPAISGPITAITLVSAGAGYTSPPVVTISQPDWAPGYGQFPGGQQASASASISGGSVTAVTLLSAGVGYFQPLVTLSSGAGSGARAIATVSGVNATVVNQEVYPFAAVNNMVALSGSGISSILAVNSITVIWGTFRYTMQRASFSKYQAQLRTYGGTYTDYPRVWAQFAQGANGSVYAYPVPNSNYQWEWDCYCLPIALVTDADPEAIPSPWTDAVPFLAAYYAFSGKQRFADADRMFQEYEKWMKRARVQSNPRSVSNWYGRP